MPSQFRKRDQVLNVLRERIISGKYLPGHPLSERAIAEEMGVSRLPVREALSKLNGSGLVEIFPNRGAEVRRISASNMESLYRVREALEGMAARLAAERMPSNTLAKNKALSEKVLELKNFKASDLSNLGDDLHSKILEGSRNSMLIEMGNSISSLIQYARHQSYIKITPEAAILVAKQHLDIINAIEKRKPDEAEKLIRYHISYWAEIVIENMAGDVNRETIL